MKIAFVISSLCFGGAQTMLLRLVESFDKKKNEIKIFVRDSFLDNAIEHRLKDLHIDIQYLNICDNERHFFQSWHKIKSLIKVNRALSAFNPDIIHVHLEYFYSLCYAILYKKKIIYTIHSQPYRIYNKHLAILLKYLNAKRLIKIVGCAKCITNDAKKIFSLDDSCCFTIYNPIDVKKYFSSKGNACGFSYIHVGRLESLKNQEMIINAFANVLKVFPNSKLIIVGDGPLRIKLENLCKKLNIENNVEFLGNRYDIPQILSEADVFVLASNTEACPMSILEAMASSLPIIATDVGGVKEISGNCGLFVEVGNVKMLANKMLLLQSDVKLRETLSQQALINSVSFSSDKIAREYMNLYLDKL